MSLEYKKLGDVADFIRGITYKPNDLVENFSEGSTVCMRTANVQVQLKQDDLLSVPDNLVKNEDKFLIEGDILVSTANSWNLVGKCCWVPKLEYSATAGGFISILRANQEKLDQRYLYHWFNSPNTQLLARNCGRQTTNISNMDLERCLSIKIPLPPLAEQRRIASILDQADMLRQKRQQAIEKLDQLLQATFIDMFGDPVSNPKGWDLVKVGDIVDEFIGGKNIECPDERESKYKILKVSAVTSKVYKPDESKFAPNNFEPNPLAIVEQGDLLFSRANTTELVAATAYVWDTPENIVLPDKLWKFSISDDSKVNKLYLWDLFKNTEFRNELSKLSSGTSGSMKNISKGKLNEMLMPLPPKEQQDKFAETSTKLWEQIKTFRRSSASLNSLFKTLQNQAFSGNL
ncbi:restriction endonuclease subunit S [Acinetobacter nosocomialis]|uniref:restriction endonuclease subunit S n=1 Tax=Acinetobacter nosocomialis TaxID=106654 RepID=UPI002F4259FF